jgi:hypothetical protein
LLVFAGWPHRAVVLPLLEALGIEIQNLPLGRARDDGGLAQLHNAWALSGAAAVLQPMLHQGDLVLAGTVRRGRGRVVVVGDSEFLLNHNLEHRESYRPENIEFLRGLLGDHP